jgi:hypothetical protein
MQGDSHENENEKMENNEEYDAKEKGYKSGSNSGSPEPTSPEKLTVTQLKKICKSSVKIIIGNE